MKKKIIGCISVAVLVVLAVAFLPLPRRVDVTLQGARVNMVDGEATDTVEIKLHGWYLNYLRKTDGLNVKLTVSPFQGKDGPVLEYQTEAFGVFVHEFAAASGARYSAERNDYVLADLYFTEDFSQVLYTDETDQDYAYVAAKDGDAGMAAILENVNGYLGN